MTNNKAEEYRSYHQDAYNTLRNYETLRSIAVTYIERNLCYKEEGESSIDLKRKTETSGV